MARGGRVDHTRCVPIGNDPEGIEFVRILPMAAPDLVFQRYADWGVDGTVDEYESDGHDEYDDNRDGIQDRVIDSVARLAGFTIEGYDHCLEPPEYPDSRILEDTDADGMFDTESVTAGQNPGGGWWSWKNTCND